MSTERSANEGRTGARKRPLWPLAALLLVMLVAVFLLRGRGAAPDRPAGEEGTGEETAFTRSAVLYYAAADGEELVAERRELAFVGSGREGFAVRLVTELAREPAAPGAWPSLPEGIVVRGVFFDDLGDLYVDFDGASLADRAWGTSSEILAIRSIVRTLAGSFPEVQRVGLLVDGKEAETLGGHVDASHPFEASEWK